MKLLRILRGVLKRTHADKLIIFFVLFFFADAFLIMLVEPGMSKYENALWYCYDIFSTVGSGDYVAVTVPGRILSVLLTILTLLVVALVTGVIVAFYNDLVSMQYKAAKADILDKLEHLEDLSKDELKDLSARIRKVL